MLRPRGLVALVLLGLVLWLTPAAYADPPDPTWLGGYWDDDDFDTVVVFLARAFAIHVPIKVNVDAALDTDRPARAGIRRGCPVSPPPHQLSSGPPDLVRD